MCFSYFLNPNNSGSVEIWKCGNHEMCLGRLEGVLGLIFAGYMSLASEPLRAPIPLLSILSPIIDPTLVTFGQISNFRNPSYIVTFYFYELIHF